SRRTALKGAGMLSAAGFLAACGIGGKTSAPTSAHVNWVWDKATKAGTLDFANWPLYIDTGTDAAGNTTYPSLEQFTKDTGIKVTMPWQSGFTGIGYNPKRTGRDITSFQDLFDPAFKGKVGMFAGNQDTGNLALVGIGVKPEKSTPADWQRAADKLKQQRDGGIVRKYYDQSYIKALAAGDTWISMAWSGDIFQANLS